MERAEQIKCTIRVFTVLMKQLSPRFSFPKGGVATKTVSSCLDSLETEFTAGLSPERMVDYCVCQVYAASRFDEGYVTSRWKVTHSFGKKALERFKETGKAKKYYEDKWLRECDLSRPMLLSLIENKKRHPLYKFIYPDYEDVTKMRMLSSEVGYYICALSTLLWTPFSPACRNCLKADLCKERTRSRYPELYRIRLEEFRKEE